MTSPKARICTVLFCIVTLGTSLWAAHTPESCSANSEISKQLDAGNYLQASKVSQKILSQDSNSAQARLGLARSFLSLGNYDEAVSNAEQAVKLAPGCSDYHLWLGRAYGLKAEKNRSFLLARKAREEFRQAVQLDPNNLLARRNLMEFYLEAPWFLGGSRDKAWDQVEAIASRDTTEGFLARAEYWREVDNPTRASEAYQQVLKLQPQRVDPYFQVADYYESSRNANQIQAALQAASRIEPRDPRLAYYRGVVRVLEGRQLPEAEQNFKRYLAQAPPRDDFPPYAAAHDWLGHIYEQWGKRQEAIREYKAALHLSPDNNTAQDRLHRLESN